MDDWLLSDHELLQIVVSNLPVAIWMTDARGVFTYVMSSRITRGEISPDVYLGKSTEDLFAKFPDVLAANRRALAGESHRALVHYGPLPYDASYHPLRDPEGKIIGTVGVAIDVTDRLKTLSDLGQTQEVTRRILEAVPAGIVMVSPTGQILDANAHGVAILGLSIDAVTQRYVSDWKGDTIHEDGSTFPPEEYPVSRCLRTREPQPPQTLGLRRPDGRVVWCVFTAIPVSNPDTKEFVGAVVTFHDISARKKEEEERAQLERQLAESQKLEAIGRLAGGLAHDLNNILSAILGHASLLKERFEVGSPDYLGAYTIELAGERAAKLTKKLLAFARQGPRESRAVDIDTTISEAIDLLSGTLRPNIRITHRRAAPSPIAVGDATQLQQVFLNLALNAQDAMPDGGDLVFETVVTDCRITVSVRDNGRGMTAEVRARIFEPFYTTKTTGTGMGLALVYGIVKGHEGTVEVKSTVGRGTTFEIVLPRAEPQAFAPAKVEVEKRHVLVVDDEEIVRNTTKLLLERLGWSAFTAQDGAQAVELYRENSDQIALVILDLVMPGMGGRECFRALQAFDPHVRAIISSGYDRDGIANDILEAGCAGFLQKPYTLAKLRDALERALA